jgi:hypothetical protein
MANFLSILPDEGRVRVFACPLCGETIALGCDRCRFCSAIIDPRAAESAADLMDRINLACSEADDVRSLLSWEPSELDLIARRRGKIDLYLLPILLLRWWLRFGSLHADDKDLIQARQDMKQYSWYAFIAVAFFLALICLAIVHA